MKDTGFQDRPIFLGGHRKSGTTMLLGLFDAHPQLCVFPPDSGFFYGYYPPYEQGDYSDAERIQRVVTVMYGNLNNEWNRLETKSDRPLCLQEIEQRFRERMSDQPTASAILLREAVLAYYDILGIPGDNHIRGWVEKTTSSEIYASQIFQWFPSARFIHLLRDPRDNFGSMKSGWQARYQKYNDSVERLLQSLLDRGGLGMKLAALNAERFGPDRYRVVRYEDLTRDPENILRDLCTFMDIEFRDILLKPTFLGLPWKGNNFDGLKFDKASSINVGRWRQRITDHEAQVIEFHLAETMARWGYEPAFSRDEQIDAAMRHYKWSNFADRYSIAGEADTFKACKS